MGFGTSPFGAAPFGSSSSDDSTVFTITYVEAIAKDTIKIHFTEEAVVNALYRDISNYAIEDGLGNPLTITSVIRTNSDTCPYVMLATFAQTEGSEYQVSIQKINSRTGSIIDNPVALWTYQRTKVDSMLSSMPAVYDTKPTSNIRAILNAIGMAANTIGGTNYGEGDTPPLGPPDPP